MTKPYLFLALLLLAIKPFSISAQTWKALGKDEINTPSLDISSYNNIKISPDGIPYIAYREGVRDSIVVKKFDGINWVRVGRTLIAGDNPKLTFDNNGTPYLSHMTDGPKGIVRKLIGDNWVKMGPEIGSCIYPDLLFAPDNTPYLKFTLAYSEGFRIRKFTNAFVPAGDVDNVAGGPASGEIAIANDGTLYTAYASYLNKNKISAKKLVAGKWESIGKDGFSNARVSNVKLVVGNNGIPYVAYQDSIAGGIVVVQRFTNDAWTVISPSDLSKGEARSISLAIGIDNLPYVTFHDAGDGHKTLVKKLNDNGTWSSIGLSTLTSRNASFIDITVAKNGTPYLTYQDYDSGGKAWVKMFAGGKWTDVGMGDISTQGSGKIIIKSNKSGRIFAAYTDDLNARKASVKEYVSGGWKYLGVPTLSAAGVTWSELDMELGADGLPYVLYKDSSQLTCVVKKYNGTSWAQLGSDIAPYGGSQFKIAVAPEGTVYVAFLDGGYGERFVVKKYINNKWQFVGKGDPAYDLTTGLNLTVDKDNTPYVAFIDRVTEKANVKRFNGTTWEYLGDQNFTEPVRDLNLITGPEGDVYLASTDKNAKQVTVNIFTKNIWQTLGDIKSSGKPVAFPKLFYSPSGQLHLAYVEANLYGPDMGQIRKLDSDQWVVVPSDHMVRMKINYEHSIAFAPDGNIIYGYINKQAFVRSNNSDDQKASPVISNLSPAVGGAGTVITIKGFNLNNASAVKIGSANAISFKVISPTLLTAVVGNGATGNVMVTTPYGNTSIEKFEYLESPPVIYSFTPRAGDVSSTVTIKGKYFSPVAAQNIVYFGAVAGQMISANDSTLVVKVPAGATSSPITVTTKQRTAYTTNRFVVTFKSVKNFTAATFNTKIGVGHETFSPTAVDIKDMDGDGKPDILVNGAIFVNGSNKGGFSFATHTEIGMDGYGIEAHDMDSDGKPDLLLPIGPVGLLKNTGTPGKVTFLANKQYIDQVFYSFSTSSNDIDGDGLPDFLSTTNAGTQLALYRNAGSANGYTFFEDPFIFETENQVAGGLLADIDGDGKTDVLVLMLTYTVSGPKGYLAVFRNTGTGNKLEFTRAGMEQNFLAGDGSTKPLIADIDNDGKVDVVVINNNANTVSVFKNLSTVNNINFAGAVNIASAKKPFAICTADFDGDGLLDLATANIGDANQNAISLLRNTSSNGLISFAPKIDYHGTFQPSSITAADLDGDEAPEIIVTNYHGDNITIFKNAVVQDDLPDNKFTISVTSATCKSSSNGSISVSATQKLSYTAKLSGKNISKDLPFDNNTKFTDLVAGEYHLCISTAELTDSEQCFDLVISEPKDLAVFSTVNEKYKTINLKLDGGSAYTITLNGASYTTRNNDIDLPLTEGNNRLVVTTDNACQGIVEKLIPLFGIISPYPVPFQDVLNINIGRQVIKNASVALYDTTSGKLVYQKKFNDQTGVLQLDVSQLKTSVYALHLILDGDKKIFKVVK